jgi:hypothetical protein
VRRGSLSGVGALAFGVLPILGFMIANPPGGSYDAADIVDYVTKGHRPVVFVSMYMLLLSGVGLALLVTRLREAIGAGSRKTVFTVLGAAAVAAWVVGYALVIGVPAAYAFGGGDKLSLAPGVVYTFAESGWAVMYGAGGTLLGCALVTFAVGRVAVPSWVRWATLVAGIAGLASLAWFPFFLVYIWAIVLGCWLLVARAEPAREPARPQLA